MKTRLVKIMAVAFTFVTVGYMSVSMSAETPKTQSVGGKGVSVGAKDTVPPENSVQDQSSGGGGIPPVEQPKEKSGCCSF